MADKTNKNTNKVRERALSTKVVRLDLDIILNNYLNKNFWKKSWCVYRNRNIKIDFRLTLINVKDEYICCQIFIPKDEISFNRLHKTINTSYLTEEIRIKLNHPEYTKTIFQNDLIRAVLRLIGSIEGRLISQYTEYRDAVSLENMQEDTLTSIAEQFLDENKVSNEDIRQAYINSFVSNNRENYTTRVLMNFKYTIIPNVYLSVCCFFNNEECYKDFSEKCTKIRESMRISMWNDRKKYQSDEYVEDMKDELESI